jgi:hypothetical protein
MTIKKYSRNQRFDDYDDRPSKPKQKDRSEKRLRNALRTNDYEVLSKLSNEDLDLMEDDFFDDYEQGRT